MEHGFAGLDEDFQTINVAAINSGTRYLGPGLRSVVWVQGCSIHCKGCIAPDWIPIRPARLVEPADLLVELLANPGVTGLTFSGGEPMMQAHALSVLARLARKERDVNILCFTGFRYEDLVKNPPFPGVADLLNEVDVLIDSPYIEKLNDNKGLRGSSNQRILHLTNRLAHFDLNATPRKSEVHVEDGQIMMVGVPPTGMEQAFRQAVTTAKKMQMELLHYERV